MYPKALNLASLRLAWDVFMVLHSEMYMSLQIIAFPGLSVNDKKGRLLSPVHYWLWNNAHKQQLSELLFICLITLKA